MNVHDWKGVVIIAIGAGVACVARFSCADGGKDLFYIAILIVGGALGMTVPGLSRDPQSRTRTTDEPERKQSER